MSLLTTFLVSLSIVVTVAGAVAYFAVSSSSLSLCYASACTRLTHAAPLPCVCQYPYLAARRREAAFRAKIASRLTVLFNTRESLQQHIDWARADSRTQRLHTTPQLASTLHLCSHHHPLCLSCAEPERARALQREVRALDEEMGGLEKELAILDQQKRRQTY